MSGNQPNKRVTLPAVAEIMARRALYRRRMDEALALLRAAHEDYPEVDSTMVEEVLRLHGRGHGPYGVTRLAGMVRNIGAARRKPPLTVAEAAIVSKQLFGPG